MEPIASQKGVRIATFNCRSVKASVNTVKQLCKENDIVLLQEHWLLPDELSYLSLIDPDFVAFGSSAVNVNETILMGRPYGGTAILCRHNFVVGVKPINNMCSRITAIEVSVLINNVATTVLLASVYMPTDTGAATDEDFEFVCGCINALIVDSSASGYIFAGDFNFRFNSLRHQFILNCLSSHCVMLADQQLLNADSFTYVSDCHNTTSWIDHILVNRGLIQAVTKAHVQYNVVSSDHRPLVFQLDAVVNVVHSNSANCDRNSYTVISDWEACSDVDLYNYAGVVNNLIESVCMPSLCCVQNCCNQQHKSDIDKYLESVSQCIVEAMQRTIPHKKCAISDHCVAGWNDVVEEKHVAAREAFLEWVSVGKPRTGYVCEIMKRTRAQFKLALRYCRNNEEMFKSNALAQNYLNDKSKFWKYVKNTSNSKTTSHASTINGVTGDEGIAEMWKESFEKLYSMHSNDGLAQEVEDVHNDLVHVMKLVDVSNAIKQLKCRKACGPDGIPAEAIKHAGHLLSVHLTLLFNMCLSHCYLPKDLTMTTVLPLIKNKSADLSDVNNYRAIAISSCFSKILETVILECFQLHDTFDDCYQFGFRKNHSTTLSYGVLKNVVDYYRHRGSYVFACFLDLSKAFDSVNHKTLFRTVKELNFPANIVKLLVHWYANQEINIRWKSIVTASFYMRNGTRQGSVLSPYLFCLYMRKITSDITSLGTGCHIGGMPVNILLYADDLVILAPSWSAQQNLLNTCVEAVSCMSMKFNASKSVSMIFTPLRTACRVAYNFRSFILDGIALETVDKCKYLGHFVTSNADDNVDILHQMSLLYARTNILIRKFIKCSRNVKLCLFRSHCLSFYGAALWNCFNVTIMNKLEAAYVKCTKMFFGFARRDSVSAMFIELGLPSFNTILHNARIRFNACTAMHMNKLVSQVFDLC